MTSSVGVLRKTLSSKNEFCEDPCSGSYFKGINKVVSVFYASLVLFGRTWLRMISIQCHWAIVFVVKFGAMIAIIYIGE
jgi:hypothetical protein